MSEVYLSALGRKQADWLATRHTLVASNIANANTPGFKVKDVKAFEATPQSFSTLVSTHNQHITQNAGNVDGIGTNNGRSWETYYSANNVSLPQESLKLGDIATSFDLNTSTMRSFHRLILTTFTG